MVIRARHSVIYRSFSSGSRVAQAGGVGKSWQLPWLELWQPEEMESSAMGKSWQPLWLDLWQPQGMESAAWSMGTSWWAVLWAQGSGIQQLPCPLWLEVSQYGDKLNLNRASPSNSCTSTGLCPIWFGGVMKPV